MTSVSCDILDLHFQRIYLMREGGGYRKPVEFVFTCIVR